MASLLTDAQKADIASRMVDLFDTVSRDIKIIRRGKKVTISSDPSFNFAYPEQIETIDEEINEYTVKAKIRYEKDQVIKFSTQESIDADANKSNQIKATIEDGTVRINVKSDGFAALNGADLFEIDGQDYVLDGGIRPRFNFGAQIYNIKLKRINKNG